MEFTTRSADNQLRHSVVPLYHGDGEVYVVASSTGSSPLSSSMQLNRKELIAYRDMLTEALRHLPELLPLDCTCTLDVYGRRQPSNDCDWHREQEIMLAEDGLGDEAEM
jgi:hypothetical protein